MKFTIAIHLVSLFHATCLGITIYEANSERRRFKPPKELLSAAMDEDRTFWIEQKLDHFNESDTRTWQMRYLGNSQYFVEGGPIWIFVGGEWEISRSFLTDGHMHDMARDQRGFMFSTEHRYYGQSHPTSDLRTENLKFLNVRQALADLAYFITFVKSQIDGLRYSKVILVGGSYAANMVTWFKRLYPDMVVGVWASSSPLRAKVNFYEYKQVAAQSIKLVGGDNCINRIQNGYAEFEKMLAENRTSELKSLLQICNGFDERNELDVWNLFSQITDFVAATVQSADVAEIQNNCNMILNGSDDVYGLKDYILSFGRGSCNDFTYKAYTDRLIYSQYSSSTDRQWMYQVCNEFGWFKTATQPFGTMPPQDYYVRTCQHLFGSQLTSEAINKLVDDNNAYLGGLNPGVQNVYFTYGQLDPWHSMGLYDPNKATILPLPTSTCEGL